MRKLAIVIVALAIITAVALGVRTLGARDETDAVDTREAAELVEDEGASEDIVAGDRPEPGTYTYTGSGHETVSALGGSRHDFPDQIPVVVQLDPDDRCRWTSNVVYVKQHIEERRYCTKNDTVVDLGFTRKIEFFNQVQETEYTCDDDAYRLKADARPGDTWEWTCAQGTSAASNYTATFRGREHLTVGGERVEVWHTRVVSKQSGGTTGSDTSEYWLAETGLPVKWTADLEVETNSILGQTTFMERLSYALVSLVPEEA